MVPEGTVTFWGAGGVTGAGGTEGGAAYAVSVGADLVVVTSSAGADFGRLRLRGALARGLADGLGDSVTTGWLASV